MTLSFDAGWTHLHERWQRESALTLLAKQWSTTKSRRQIGALLSHCRRRHDQDSISPIRAFVRNELDPENRMKHDALCQQLDRLCDCGERPQELDLQRIREVHDKIGNARKEIEQYLCQMLQRKMSTGGISFELSEEVLRKLCISLRAQPWKMSMAHGATAHYAGCRWESSLLAMAGRHSPGTPISQTRTAVEGVKCQLQQQNSNVSGNFYMNLKDH